MYSRGAHALVASGRGVYAKIAVVILLVAVTIWAIASGVRGLAIVEGRSMEPLFHTGDIVILEKPDPSKIRVGTIIVYRDAGRYIIHRVIKIYKYGDTICYVVKGDNNPVPDPGLPPCPYQSWYRGVPLTAVKGVVLAVHNVPVKIPYLGGLTLVVRG